MVCSLGSGRMAVMARLLSTGTVSQTITEEVGQHKLAAHDIHRELREADEANLLDEEDMHVFGLMPMTDPLHLVCCNACKKPVKASQYSVHAELCRSLNSAEEMALELDGGVGHRKPPRRERKKSLTASTNQATPVGEHERSESIDADCAAASASSLVGQPGIPSSFFTDAKRNSAYVDLATMRAGKGVSPENTEHSACVIPPPTKRSKLISNLHRSLSDDTETASGLTKMTATQDPFICQDFQIQSTSACDAPNGFVASKFPLQYHERCQLVNDIPVPLATKIYYSQRNNRLRLAVTDLYHMVSAKGRQCNVVSPEASQESIMKLQASSHSGSSQEQAADLLIKKFVSKQREPAAYKPDLILSQSSEACLDKSEGCEPLANLSNQLPVDSSLRAQTAPDGLFKSNYISKLICL